MLGVHDDLLSGNLDQAKGLANAIAAHQFGPTQEGQDLTKALVDMMSHILPGEVLDRMPQILIRFLLGKEWAGWLGISEGLLAELAAQPLRFLGLTFGDITEDSKVLGQMAEKAGNLFVGALMFVERGGNRPSFDIPTDLRQVWGVNWTS
jgi:hypothetical protein